MTHDRLRDDRDEIHTLDDIIEAREGKISHFADDIDALETDIEISEDTDVDEALTFPHPKHKAAEEIELMDTPNPHDVDDDWDPRDVLPSDYSHGYNEALTTDPRDDEEEIIEERVHHLGDLGAEDITEEPITEIMPGKFVMEPGTEPPASSL